MHEGGFGIHKSTEGATEFSNPAGKIISTGPDTRSRGNFLALFDAHADSGIRITPKTAQSQWLGEKMDDDMAIQVMLQLQ